MFITSPFKRSRKLFDGIFHRDHVITSHTPHANESSAARAGSLALELIEQTSIDQPFTLLPILLMMLSGGAGVGKKGGQLWVYSRLQPEGKARHHEVAGLGSTAKQGIARLRSFVFRVGWRWRSISRVEIVNDGTGLAALGVLSVRPVFLWILRKDVSIENGASQSMVTITYLVDGARVGLLRQYLGVHASRRLVDGKDRRPGLLRPPSEIHTAQAYRVSSTTTGKGFDRGAFG